MQLWAVPLIDLKAPFVGTGMEYQAAHDSGATVIAQHGEIRLPMPDGQSKFVVKDGSLDVYRIQKFRDSKLRYCL